MVSGTFWDVAGRFEKSGRILADGVQKAWDLRAIWDWDDALLRANSPPSAESGFGALRGDQSRRQFDRNGLGSVFAASRLFSFADHVAHPLVMPPWGEASARRSEDCVGIGRSFAARTNI